MGYQAQKISGGSRLNLQEYACDGMRQRETIGMQGLPGHAFYHASTIRNIASQRVSHGCHMHPNLVGTSGMQNAAHQATLCGICQ